MHVADWIDMTEADSDTVTSSFLDQVSWRTNDPEPLQSDTYGDLVVWIEYDGALRKYVYPSVERSIYEALRNEAHTGEKPGAVFNRRVRGNSEIGEPERIIEQETAEVPT